MKYRQHWIYSLIIVGTLLLDVALYRFFIHFRLGGTDYWFLWTGAGLWLIAIVLTFKHEKKRDRHNAGPLTGDPKTGISAKPRPINDNDHPRSTRMAILHGTNKPDNRRGKNEGE